MGKFNKSKNSKHESKNSKKRQTPYSSKSKVAENGDNMKTKDEVRNDLIEEFKKYG